jgi:LPS export ABC transporter protein LptC
MIKSSCVKLLAVLFFVLLISCNETKVEPKVALISSEDLPDQESHDAKIIFTEEGQLKAILHADTIKVFSEKREKDLSVVHIDFYEGKKKTSSITSKKGKIDDRTQDMYAIGNVVAVSDSGITLTTDELVWKKRKKKIVTDKFVKIKSDKEIIEGYGFESDQDMKNYTIFNITYVTTLEN